MSKDRKYVAKGSVRNRQLVPIDKEDNKRFLTYNTKSKAEAGFKVSGFYGQHRLDQSVSYVKLEDLPKYLEAVECEISITTIN